jgi:hypothetical protein
MVRSWFPELQRFLSRPSPNSLLTVRYALSGLGELGTAAAEFVARYDERLLFAQHAGGPPLPSRPLHFQHSNSLGLLLPLLVLSRPRRIFLVGADGGGHPRMKRPYFFYEDVDKESGQQDFLERPDLLSYQGNPERLEETNRRLRVEAISSDETLRRTLLFIEGIFDVPIPPIYNVCPHSSHVAYPRIDVETAMAMLRDESS